MSLFRPRTLAEALRYLRNRSRLTIEQLADEAGVSVGSVSNYESGKHEPGVRAMWRLARVLATHLRTTPGDIIGEVMGIAEEEESRLAAAELETQALADGPPDGGHES